MVERQSKNLTIGRGEVWFSQFAAGTQIGTGFELLGNCPSFTMNLELEKKEHYSSMGGLKKKDASIVVQKTATGSITCDDVRASNMARYIGAALTTVTTATATGATSTIASTLKDRRYQIGVSPTAPTGVRGITNVVVTDSAPTTYVVDVDYTVDLELGMIDILESGSIADATTLTITYDVSAANSREVLVSSDDEIEGELKYIAYNATGPNIDYFFPRAKLTPNGEFNLIGEEFLTLPFSIEGLQRDGLALVYGDGRPVTA